MKRELLKGKRFGKLLVLEDLPSRLVGDTQKRKRAYCLCRCDCGKVVEKRKEAIVSGTSSCGCILNEMIAAVNYKHGHAKKRKEYRIWSGMRSRCSNPKDHKYNIYGGRGIKVCERWDKDYLAFLEDMGSMPDGKSSIDRVDPNKGYEPSNCRWSDPKEQANNTRKNVFLTHDGLTLTMKQWSEKLGVNYKSFHANIKYKGKEIKDFI